MSAYATALLDFEEMKTGFQAPKAAALADWSFRKEQAAFEKVVNRLRVRKWAKDNPQKRRDIANRYARKPGAAARSAELAKARRLRAHRDAGVVVTCPECGAQFCEVWPRRGLARRFCGVNCDARYRYHQKHPEATRRKPATPSPGAGTKGGA